jgi:ribonucleotide monophosphatase NagD (HAD superfamily)
MVGDDIANDVVAAQDVGMIGVLVRTGKFREDDLAAARPDHVLETVGDLPALLAPA